MPLDLSYVESFKALLGFLKKQGQKRGIRSIRLLPSNNLVSSP